MAAANTSASNGHTTPIACKPYNGSSLELERPETTSNETFVTNKEIKSTLATALTNVKDLKAALATIETIKAYIRDTEDLKSTVTHVEEYQARMQEKIKRYDQEALARDVADLKRAALEKLGKGRFFDPYAVDTQLSLFVASLNEDTARELSGDVLGMDDLHLLKSSTKGDVQHSSWKTLAGLLVQEENEYERESLRTIFKFVTGLEIEDLATED